MAMSSSSFRSVVDAKIAERTHLLSSAPPFSDEYKEILHSTAVQIVARIQQGDWTASQVLEAYISRAAFAQSKTNCVTEVLFEDARRRAKELDAEFTATGKLRGPLHGVPCSLKDLFNYAGYDSTIGFTRWAHKPATDSATLVKQMIAAGAIPFIKTNVPQTMFAFECSNPLWGQSLNPYSKDFTCGGSSGGEAALLALNGSALGLGSDVGGSLRIPSAYCGVYGFKPSFGRISIVGTKGAVPGFEGIPSVLGPLSRSVEDLMLFCKVIFGEQDPANYQVAPVPYRPVELAPKLHFGYYTSVGWVRASPAVKRAINETVQALRNAGHTCTEFEPPSVIEAIAIFVGLTSSDAYKTMLSHLGPDPLEHSVWLVTTVAKLPGFVRSFAAWLAGTVMGDKMFAEVSRHARAKPFNEYLEYTVRRNKFNLTFYEDVWNKHGFDGIIAPVQALPQLPHGGCTDLSSLACETLYYNVVDSPIGCMPVTHVDPIKDALTDEWTQGPLFGSILTEERLYRGRNPRYDPEKAKGMPVGIQVIGKRWEDEKVLAMMRVVQDALKKEGMPSFGPDTSEAGKTQ